MMASSLPTERPLKLRVINYTSWTPSQEATSNERSLVARLSERHGGEKECQFCRCRDPTSLPSLTRNGCDRWPVRGSGGFGLCACHRKDAGLNPVLDRKVSSLLGPWVRLLPPQKYARGPKLHFHLYMFLKRAKYYIQKEAPQCTCTTADGQQSIVSLTNEKHASPWLQGAEKAGTRLSMCWWVRRASLNVRHPSPWIPR